MLEPSPGFRLSLWRGAGCAAFGASSRPAEIDSEARPIWRLARRLAAIATVAGRIDRAVEIGAGAPGAPRSVATSCSQMDAALLGGVQWVGARLWRKAHRATIVVYLLGVVHALGAGTDASSVWLRWWLVVTGVPSAALFAYRLGAGARAGRRKRAAPRPAGPPVPITSVR